MRNFRFNNEYPSNYPLYDNNFIPIIEFSEKKISISKISIKKSSEEELSKLNSPRTMILPLTLTSRQLHELLTSTTFILDHFEGLKKDMFLQIRNQINEIINYNQNKEIQFHKFSALPDNFWKMIFINDFSNPLIKEISMYKELPQFVDWIIQNDYNQGNIYSLEGYDDYKKFAYDFLTAVAAKLLKSESKAQEYMKSSDNSLLDNLSFNAHEEQVFKMLVEKINMLKADITEQSPSLSM